MKSKLLESTINNTVTHYQYDDNGNLISQTVNGQTTNYTWDLQNRLVESKTADGDVISYEYNDENIRVSSTVNGVKTTYLVDSNRPYAQVLEEYEDDNLKVHYVHGLDLISVEKNGEASIYLVDGLGSTRVLSDLDGNVVATYTYEAFGNLIESTGDIENNYLFAGEQFDENLEEYYLRQRYYNQEVGRFTRRDIYEGRINEPITLHKYLYGNANPVTYIDPTGLYSIAEAQAASSIANTLNELTLNFGFDVVNYIVGGKEPSLSDLGWTVLFPIVGMAGQYLPKFLGGSKALKKLNDVWGVTDSSVLRANMKNAGRTVPKFPNAAHHIVPGAANDRNAMIARTHLAKLGFNANDEINGVFLEFRKKGVEQLGKGAIHNDIHTATYYNEVRKRVTKATSKKAAEKVLRKIAKELENNTFPY